MERVAAGRDEEIAREKANAERLSREINAEIESLILCTKRLGQGMPYGGRYEPADQAVVRPYASAAVS